MENKVISIEDFINDIKTIDGVDEKGNIVKYVLLHDNRIATVREGKGKDVERATMESSGDQSKYLSSLMSACTKIEGKGINMFDFSELKIKDYTAIQIAFAEINF
jgi:exopolysaccharide biosynthesis protein